MINIYSAVFAVIMAGGSGTRFWPLSREKMPKQLLKIGGEETLIQETVKRILPVARKENIFIVTNHSLVDEIISQLSSKFELPWEENIVLEPQAKNTAPALGLAALHLERLNKESIMFVLAADHAIRNDEAFLACLDKAADAARLGYLVTLGIKPDRPDTGYGYIREGSSYQEREMLGIRRVAAFVEKPDIETAKRYLKEGGYYWNSGIFIWKTKTLLQEIEKHAPKLYAGLVEIRESIGTEKETEVIKRVFKNLQSVSIDYAVMEKTDKAVVIPADIGWSDVGSWSALDDVSEHNASGNIVFGNVIDMESSDSIIYAEKRLVATIGLKDTVVVDTPDATLVCSKDRSQDVKKIVEELKKRKSGEHLIHRTVNRPWGSYTILEEGERYKIKRLVIHPGARISQQLHHHRSEHWVVVAGIARVTNGDRIYDVHPNESTYIPISTTHRLENPGRVPLQIIEVQNGEYLEEDDIVRFDDEYNRHAKKRPYLPSLANNKEPHDEILH
jgi:mannose-1-phosphate guanylyltransferase/mannose-6-phosphate isomerase